MGRLFILFFALPWWVYFPLAGGVAWLGQQVHVSALEEQAERAAALAAGAPEPVDIGVFNLLTNRNLANEVTVRGWIDNDLNYELVKARNGVTVSQRYMYMLFGEDDPEGSQVVRGAIVLTEAERDRFTEMLDGFWVDFSRNGFIFELNGFGETNVTFGGLAFDAIAEKGLTRDEDFIFVSPFFDGREVALAAGEAPHDRRQTFWLLAAGLVLIGMGKRVIGVLFAKSSRGLGDPADGADLPPSGQPAAQLDRSAIPQPPGRTDNTPLGRIKAGKTLHAAAGAQEISPPVPPADQDGPEAARTAGGDPFPTGVAGLDEASPAAPEAKPKRLGDVIYFAALALAMLGVWALAYNPSMAIDHLGPLGLVGLGLVVAWRVVRRGGRQGAAEVI